MSGFLTGFVGVDSAALAAAFFETGAFATVFFDPEVGLFFVAAALVVFFAVVFFAADFFAVVFFAVFFGAVLLAADFLAVLLRDELALLGFFFVVFLVDFLAVLLDLERALEVFLAGLMGAGR